MVQDGKKMGRRQGGAVVSDKHLERKEVLNLVYTQQADRMADAYARLMADFSQMTAWGRGLESDLSRARVELMLAKAEVEELTGLLKASTYYNTSEEVTRLKAEVERLKSLKAELKVGVTSEGEKPDQSDKDFKITIGFNSLDEFERDVASARQLIPEIIALANLSKGGQS